MEHFPIDIIGNYEMQYAKYNKEATDIDTVRDEAFPIDREKTKKNVTFLREKFGFTQFAGENVEYRPSGCITFPILGTKAALSDKLAFAPDRKKRRAIYDEVKASFPDYVVFVGGSSSFDMAPKPYDKAYAHSLYCEEHGISRSQVVYVGDDYDAGGNDKSVYLADYNFVKIDDYTTIPEKLAFLL